MDKYICIHGHFYQPPRENPWLEEVELQDSAYPYHDWNERITAECYAPNSASRILNPDNLIIDIVNNYSKINFNFGPTLLSWMERHQPETYLSILEADRVSAKRYSGHGSAMAQIYNHMIMPLANKRDKITQTLWSIKDFTRRFGRFPEGIWLPETAIDLETLEVISELGLRYTVLSPHQIQSVKKLSEETWHKVKEGEIDPTMAYLCRLPSGKTIHIFIYDGPISREVAFGDLLNNGELLATKLLGALREERERPQIVHIATDGETFGHHHRHADMALSYCLYLLESKNNVKLTNYGEYLAKNPTTHMVNIVENSSWSCMHGIERWRSNCGCNIGTYPGGKQAWRAPLREGLDWLRDRVSVIFEESAAGYLRDPWRARDDYIEVVSNRSKTEIERFFKRHMIKTLNNAEMSKMLKLLEMQRNAMLMFTSCGWFFDDISGIESVQILQYACRVIQLAEEIQPVPLEPELLDFLRDAPSLLQENGAVVYERYVKPSNIDLPRVGAHYAISSLFESQPGSSKIYCYNVNNMDYERVTSGKLKLAIGTCRITSDVTWEEETIGFAVLDLGDHSLTSGICLFPGLEVFIAIGGDIKAAFNKGDVPEVIRLLHIHFGSYLYSISSLFKDEQRKILNRIMKLSYDGISAAYGQIHEDHYTLMNFFKSLQISLPKPLKLATEYVINADLQEILQKDELDLVRLETLVKEAKRWPVEVDNLEVGYLVSVRIEAILKRFSMHPEDTNLLDYVSNLLNVLAPLQIDLNLWKSQNIYFSIGKGFGSKMDKRAREGDIQASQWIKSFGQLKSILRIGMP
ncbi:MAG: DUF3536 domain-containing protein [Nitrospiria bacterium]